MKAETNLVLGGRYRLLELLATGGMGEVWTANDLSVGRSVAVKVLREEYTGNLEFLRRLRTEARNSAALAHPNIAQMYDYGEEAGTGYLVMELVPGESLADLLDRQPVLPAQKLIPILADTARGLHHAHSNSVVHRDVKPGNILLQEVLPGTHPKVKITDFGVSLAANQAPMTATGMVMGTAQYLSPEQAVGSAATARSDLYALGVIAYEASTGKRPFTGKSPVDIAIAHVNDPVPPLPRHVDPHLGQIIMALLAKDPDRRPENAAVLAAQLDALVTPEPKPAPQVEPASATAPEPPKYSSRLERRSAGTPLVSHQPHQPHQPHQAQPAHGSLQTQHPDFSQHPQQAHAPGPGAHHYSVNQATPPPVPIRSSVRRPVSPVGNGAYTPPAEVTPRRLSSFNRPRANINTNGTGPSTTTPAHAHLATPKHVAVLPEARPVLAEARSGVPDPSVPIRPKPPSRLVIGAVVLGLIIVLYLIVRHFADDAAGMGAQMSVAQGTISLVLFYSPTETLFTYQNREAPRWLTL